jgi:hypothetical protein
MEDARDKAPVLSSASPAKPAEPPLGFRRDEDFIARYANNVQIESSGWDLKLVFGLLDQRDTANPMVEQHTSINLTWPEVKIGIYVLSLHLALHEMENGKVQIPARGLPLEIPEVIPPEFDNPQGREAFAIMRKMRKEFIDSLSKP